MAKMNKEEKREMVLQNAAMLFSQNGYSATTIAQIAKAAGVSFGSVFTYFENKDDLFKAAILEPLENRLKPQFILQPNPTIPAIEQIKTMIKEHFKLFAKEGVYLRLIQYVLGQHYERFPEIFHELDNFLIQAKDALSQLVTKAQEEGSLEVIDPEIVALSYISFLNGTRLTILDEPENSIWEYYCSQALRLFGPIKHE